MPLNSNTSNDYFKSFRTVQFCTSEKLSYPTSITTTTTTKNQLTLPPDTPQAAHNPRKQPFRFFRATLSLNIIVDVLRRLASSSDRVASASEHHVASRRVSVRVYTRPVAGVVGAHACGRSEPSFSLRPSFSPPFDVCRRYDLPVGKAGIRF